MRNDILDPNLRSFGATAAESKLLSDRIAALAEIARSVKIFNPPLGIEVPALARYDPHGDECGPFSAFDGAPAETASIPLAVELSLPLCDYFHFTDETDTKPVFTEDTQTETHFFINDPCIALLYDCFGANGPRMEDRRPICFKPMEVGRTGGQPIYAIMPGVNWSFLYFTNGRPIWVPVTREEFVKILIKRREAELAQQKADFQEQEKALGKERKTEDEIRREVEKMYAELEKDPVKREKLVSDAVKTAVEMQEIMFKSLEPGRKALAEVEKIILDPLRRELEKMSSAEKTSPAWYGTNVDVSSTLAAAGSGLVAAGAPHAREIVTVNPDYFEKGRPRTDIQLIVVMLEINGDAPPDPDPNEPHSRLRSWEFIHQMDWKRVADFVQPAR
jgi:hypothetical protein